MYTSPFFHNHLLRCQKQNRKERITQVDYYHGHISNGRQSIGRILSETLFIAFLTLILVAQGSSAQPSFVFESCQSVNGNYTTNSPYQANLNRILSNFTSGYFNGSGFYNFSYGQKSDQVHAIGLCRGDLEPDSCRTCLNQSTHLLTQFCPNQKEAIGGFSECMLRYSNRSLLGLMETQPRFYSWNDRNVSSNFTVGFSRDLRVLFEDLKNQAAIGGSLSKYAMGNYTGDREFDRSLYAIAQCTPDLSQLDCKNCLDEAFGDVLGQNGSVRVGGRVITPSCNFRYEVFPFYGNGNQSDASPESRLQSTPTPPPPLTRKGKKSNKSRTVIIAVVPSVASAVLIISIGVYSRVKKSIQKKEENRPIAEVAEEIGCVENLQFEFSTIRVATNNFSQENKIEQGSLSLVYRGRLRDGQNIAVKCFNVENSSRHYFKNELLLNAKLQQRNLVRLLGFCLSGDKRFLVYEFLPQRLDRLIFDPLLVEHSYLDWDKRYKIIRGIARGLLYLHEDCRFTIIHRDIKATKILLDEQMNPKISGFGYAKLFEVDQRDDSHSTQVMGTLGYLDPEYCMSGRVSVKTDVYSFGVLLLEIVSGQRAISFNHDNGEREQLISTVWRNWRDGTALDLVDPEIRDGTQESEIMRCIHIGLLCVQTRSHGRPTMRGVVHMLDCNSLSLPIPTENGDYQESSFISECSLSSVFNSGAIESDYLENDSIQEAADEVSITEPNNAGVVS